jgi:hypothetical protein
MNSNKTNKKTKKSQQNNNKKKRAKEKKKSTQTVQTLNRAPKRMKINFPLNIGFRFAGDNLPTLISFDFGVKKIQPVMKVGMMLENMM